MMSGQADLLGTQPLDRKGGEDHVLDAEPGVDRINPLLKERGDMMRIAARPRRAERQALDPAIDPMKGEHQPPRAGPLARQSRNEILGQPFGR